MLIGITKNPGSGTLRKLRACRRARWSLWNVIPRSNRPLTPSPPISTSRRIFSRGAFDKCGRKPSTIVSLLTPRVAIFTVAQRCEITSFFLQTYRMGWDECQFSHCVYCFLFSILYKECEELRYLTDFCDKISRGMFSGNRRGSSDGYFIIKGSSFGYFLHRIYHVKATYFHSPRALRDSQAEYFIRW